LSEQLKFALSIAAVGMTALFLVVSLAPIMILGLLVCMILNKDLTGSEEYYEEEEKDAAI
jgi:hypothetical protein